MVLLAVIKRLAYTGGANDLNIRYNKSMAHINLMNIYQDKFHDIQEIQDEYVAMRKVCDELKLCFGLCKRKNLLL